MQSYLYWYQLTCDSHWKGHSGVCREFFLLVSPILCLRLSPSVPLFPTLSLNAIQIQHSDPYQHWFLFMSLSSARRRCTSVEMSARTKSVVLPRHFFTPVNKRHIHIYLPDFAWACLCICHSCRLLLLLHSFTLLSPSIQAASLKSPGKSFLFTLTVRLFCEREWELLQTFLQRFAAKHHVHVSSIVWNNVEVSARNAKQTFFMKTLIYLH